MLSWKDEYAIGVESIDEQHRHLFEIGNRAYELLKDEFCIDKYDKVAEILDELEEYTRYHFESEEQYMQEIEYQGYFMQKVEHDKFLKTIEEEKSKLAELDEVTDKDIENILSLVFEWVLNHILKRDKDIKSN